LVSPLGEELQMYAISARMQPMDQMSTLLLYYSLCKMISGGLYHLATMWSDFSLSFSETEVYFSGTLASSLLVVVVVLFSLLN
jgi:hypothetical protein